MSINDIDSTSLGASVYSQKKYLVEGSDIFANVKILCAEKAERTSN
jgi:hypothetical protein